MKLSLGRQSAATLAIGDRYIAIGLDQTRHEVTVAYVTENLDDSFNVQHQYADTVRRSRHTFAAVVHVTYRAPCCPHNDNWADCGRCGDVEWPAEIMAAYMGDAPARGDHASA